MVSATWGLFAAATGTADSSLSTQSIAPPNLNSATSRAGGAIQLAWSATATAAQRPDLTFVYYVYRSNGGPATLVNASGTTALSYADTPSADGTWTYSVAAGVSSFVSVNSNAISALSDRLAPTVTLTCGSNSCTSSWYRAPVIVTISAQDAGTGVASIAYVLDGTSTTISGATTSFTIGDGIHQLRYSAADQAGNTSTTVSLTLRVDSTPPSVGTPIVCDYSGDVAPVTSGWISPGSTYRVLATISDATSGVGSASATVTVAGAGVIASATPLSAQALTCGGASFSYASALLAAPATIPAGSGSTTIAVTATDVAGNSASATGTGGTDGTPPTLKGVSVVPGATGQLVASWTGTDTLSGIAGFMLVVDLAGTTTPAPQYVNPVLLGPSATSYTFNLTSRTRYDVYLYAVDNAGNNSPASAILGKRAT
ncbi:MAG TPA: Ig-like domain repeat protein [Mycobacterium sp.]|nr:Ig-like domain repeat protein [Mycobacterium sp.]